MNAVQMIKTGAEYNTVLLDMEHINASIVEMHNPCEWPDDQGPDLVALGYARVLLHCLEMAIDDFDELFNQQTLAEAQRKDWR